MSPMFPDPGPTLQRSNDLGLSRRRALQLTAIGLGAATLPGCGAPAGEGADWTAADIPSLQGRTALVTGANGFPRGDTSGLGYQAALNLARAGADVTIASSRSERGAEAVRQIRAAVPGASVRFERLDLGDLGAVRSFAGRWREEGRALDLLVNNAGVMGRREREMSVDGFERVLAINVLGPFALTAGLLPLLRAGASPRVVWVGSLRMSGGFDFNDPQMAVDYDYGRAYDRSKLGVLLMALEMQRRSLAGGWGVMSLACHPGVARTYLIEDGPGLDSPEGFRRRHIRFMFHDAAQNVVSTLFAAAAPQAQGGSFVGLSRFLTGGPTVITPAAAALDQNAARTLWDVLERLTGEAFG